MVENSGVGWGQVKVTTKRSKIVLGKRGKHSKNLSWRGVVQRELQRDLEDSPQDVSLSVCLSFERLILSVPSGVALLLLFCFFSFPSSFCCFSFPLAGDVWKLLKTGKKQQMKPNRKPFCDKCSFKCTGVLWTVLDLKGN